MIFHDIGNKKEIEFEETDTLSEKRIVEQGLALLRNILVRIKEVEKPDGK